MTCNPATDLQLTDQEHWRSGVSQPDIIIQNGLVYDGTGEKPVARDIWIRDGKVLAMSIEPIHGVGKEIVINAEGKWVLPGFVDIHTHYDAEILVSPGLKESVRHGVTSVFIGSCSLSTIYSSPEDCTDMFSRVEAIPRKHMLDALGGKSWSTASEYKKHLESLPLGPNVAAFVGQSDLRTHVMGLGRAVNHEVRPEKVELDRMAELLEDALEEGFLGLSGMTTPWDKLDGERYRSRSLPATFATWKENRRLNKVLRKKGRVLQSAPNTTQPLNFFLFLIESSGFYIRKSLRTSLLVAADSKAIPTLILYGMLGIARWSKKLMGSDLTW